MYIEFLKFGGICIYSYTYILIMNPYIFSGMRLFQLFSKRKVKKTHKNSERDGMSFFQILKIDKNIILVAIRYSFLNLYKPYFLTQVNKRKKMMTSPFKAR